MIASLLAGIFTWRVALGALCTSDDYTNMVYMDEDETFELYWTTDFDEDIIEMCMQAQTTGWIAVGFSENATMSGSDMFVGYVDDDGDAYLEDRYVLSCVDIDDCHEEPVLDSVQDLTLVSGSEENSITSIRFERSIWDCDANGNEDRSVGITTTNLIYAFGATDTFETHLAADCGHTKVNFIADDTFTATLEDDVQYFDLNFSDPVDIDANSNVYWCELVELPISDDDVIYHIVKFEPLVQEANAGVVTRILLNVCSSAWIDNTSWVGYQGDCMLWDSWKKTDMPKAGQCVSATPAYGWSTGHSSFTFPQHVGMEMGGDKTDNTTFNYGMLEVSYENLDEHSGLTDQSGVRVYYTATLRDNSAAVIEVGQNPEAKAHIIPPGLTNALTIGYCDTKCTDHGLPTEGVTAIASTMHMQSLGVAGRFRHVRDGVELPYLALDWNYDYNYQQWYALEDEITILPGDDLIMECHYDTTGEDYWTFGGPDRDSDFPKDKSGNYYFNSTNAKWEKCLGFVMVYPVPDLRECRTKLGRNPMRWWIAKGIELGYLEGNATSGVDVTFNYDMEGAQAFYNNYWTSTNASGWPNATDEFAYAVESSICKNQWSKKFWSNSEYDFVRATVDEENEYTFPEGVCEPASTETPTTTGAASVLPLAGAFLLSFAAVVWV